MSHEPERSDARANRKRILDAAMEIIAERGAAAEIKEVAERAGVGVGTIYRNFATKDDLLRGILEEVLRQFDEVRDRALALDDPVEAVSTFVREMYHVLDRWSPVAMAMLSGAFTDEVKEHFLDFLRDRRLEAVFKRGIDEGVFRADLPIELARGMLINTCDPLIYLAVQDIMTHEQMAAGYTDMILRAIRAPAT